MTTPSYTVTAIKRTDPPEGAAGGTWYHYVIANGRSEIAGSRQGSRDQVREHAEAFAAELTQRAQRGYSVWAPRRSSK